MKDLDVNEYVKQNKQKYDFKEYSDDDTYAIRDLKTASQHKLLWKFITELGIPDTREEKLAVFYYFNGKYKSIANQHIFYCREKMQPSKWYYNVNERLPKKIKFIPKFKAERLMYKETVGHIKLEKLQKEYSMPELCDKFDLNLYQMKNIRYKRINPLTKKECFKILPPASVIIKLRDVINPDYWFIFPEEIE